jgi:hypothetical protein
VKCFYSSFPYNSVFIRGKCFRSQLVHSASHLSHPCVCGAHSLLAVSMDFRIRENDGKGFPPLFRVIPCSSVANASSLLGRSPRIFTAKTLRTPRSSRKVWISCLPLRPLRLRGENAFMLHFRVIPCSSVANASLCKPSLTLPALIFRVGPWQMLVVCKPSLTLPALF